MSCNDECLSLCCLQAQKSQARKPPGGYISPSTSRPRVSLFREALPSFQDTVGAVSALLNRSVLTGSTQPASDQLEGNASLLLDYIYSLLP